jgi:hypothetical protein
MQAVAAHFSATTLFRPLYRHRRKEATGQPERSIEMTKQQDQAVNVLVGMALLARTPIQATADVILTYDIRGIPAWTERMLTQAASRRLWDAFQLADRIRRDARLKKAGSAA